MNFINAFQIKLFQTERSAIWSTWTNIFCCCL